MEFHQSAGVLISPNSLFFSGVGLGSVELRKRNSFQRMSATRERDTLDNTQVSLVFCVYSASPWAVLGRVRKVGRLIVIGCGRMKFEQ